MDRNFPQSLSPIRADASPAPVDSPAPARPTPSNRDTAEDAHHNDKNLFASPPEDLAGVVVLGRGPPAPPRLARFARRKNLIAPSRRRRQSARLAMSAAAFSCQAGFYLGAAVLPGSMLGWPLASLGFRDCAGAPVGKRADPSRRSSHSCASASASDSMGGALACEALFARACWPAARHYSWI